MSSDSITSWLQNSGISPWIRSMYESNPMVFLLVCGFLIMVVVQTMFREPPTETPASKSEDSHSDYY